MPYKNKEKQKAAQKSHYEKNRSQYKARDKARLEKARNYVNNIKKQSKCIDCGESRWQCLDFDHIDRTQKFSTVGKMVKSRYSVEKIQEEIDKCEVRCANCHRIKTWENKDWESVK